MLNQHLLNFKIIKQLGEGGMATVYLAEHTTLGHHVAIKILNKEFIHNKNIRSRFIDEAKKMVRMNHPNVVKVIDLINDADTVAIVMEYVDGETLRDLLSKKKLTDSEIENYLKQMVAALEYVHKQGLVHRDIKPSNFIFNQDGNLKLTDFGISKNLSGDLDGHTQTSTALSLGTPMYMSPEQVRSTKDVTYLSDIYSLGVVLLEMVTGKKPYDLDTLSSFDLMTKVVNEPLPLTATKWDGVIQKATEKLEEKRFQSAGEVLLGKEPAEKKNIETKIVDEDITVAYVRPEGVKEPIVIEEKPRKKKLIVILASVGILILLVSTAVYMDLERARLRTLQTEEESVLNIGDYYQGGIIYWLDETGKHGGVITENDLAGEYNWYKAMNKCANSELNGYSDWYLPDNNDCFFINNNLVDDFADNYWSSTEYDDTGAYILNFIDGDTSYYADKTVTFPVREVRSF